MLWSYLYCIHIVNILFYLYVYINYLPAVAECETRQLFFNSVTEIKGEFEILKWNDLRLLCLIAKGERSVIRDLSVGDKVL